MIVTLCCCVFYSNELSAQSIFGDHVFESFPANPRFERIPLEKHVSISSVLTIHKDKYGFMWFGGKDGLVRFDGFDYVVYTHDPLDPHSISSSVIWDIAEDDEGNLWLATEKGLNFYERKSQQFSVYAHADNSVDNVRRNRTLMLFKEGENLWVGNDAGIERFNVPSKSFTRYPVNEKQQGLYSEFFLDMAKDENGFYYFATGYGFKRWNTATDQVDTYQTVEGDPTSLKNNLCRSVLVTRDNTIWVGCDYGVHQFNPTDESFEYYPLESSVNEIKRYDAWDMLEDVNGEIWVAMDMGGIAKINKAKKTVTHFSPNPIDENTPATDVSRSVFEDELGDLWFGHYPTGVTTLKRYNTTIRSYSNTTYDQYSLTNERIYSIAEDENQNLWFGTDGGGLNFFDSETNTYTPFTHQPNNIQSLPSNKIQTVMVAKNKDIWIGMWSGGATRINHETGEYQHFLQSELSNQSIFHPHITTLLESANGNIWLGAMEGGLSRYNPSTGEIKTWFHDPTNPNSILANRIWAITQSQDNLIWVGTHNGLSQFDPSTNTFSNYKVQTDENYSNTNWIYALMEDSNNNIWIGTHGKGVYLLNRKTNEIIPIKDDIFLPGNIINGFIEDNFGKIWIPTNKGLSVYDPDTNKISLYREKHGLQSDIFLRGAALKRKNGELVFGGTHGYTIIDPKAIRSNPFPPETVITEIEVNNSVVDQIRTPELIDKNIFLEDRITLSHEHNSISITFSALAFRLNSMNKYRYKLFGFDHDWIETSRRRVTYTNLSAGKYTFKVQSANNEGIWDISSKNLYIKVKPAPWASWWAYSLYVFLILSAIIYYIITKNKILNYQKTIISRLKNVDALKDQIIANTSHELKTPIFGIMGLCQNIIRRESNKIDSESLSELNMIISSTNRLYGQVQDILDYESSSGNEFEMDFNTISSLELIELVVKIFEPTCSQKNITIKVLNNVVNTNVYADSNRIQQALYNIINNSIKNSPPSEITISIDGYDHSHIKITVSDRGCGIPAYKLSKIFNAFEKLFAGNENYHSGSGLGLTITRNIIKHHHGEIWIESKVGKGTDVSFILQRSPDSESVPVSVYHEVASRINSQGDVALPVSDIESNKVVSSSKPRVLVVDDEIVNRIVIKGYLENENFEIFSVSTGVGILEQIKHHKIDVVLLDIMMPDIPGTEVCKIIRDEYSANVLPVIFITAKNEINELELAFSVGANDFLTKPLSAKELTRRISLHLQLVNNSRNLEKEIDTRTKELQEAYKKLEKLTVTDSLTQIHNRHFFLQIIESLNAESYRQVEKDSIHPDGDLMASPTTFYCLLDIDDFKHINDTYGHSCGDQVLLQSARRIKSQLRGSDYLIRWGGEEFLIILRNLPRDNAEQAAQKLLNAFAAEPLQCEENTSINVTCSIGLCAHPVNPLSRIDVDWEKTLDIADTCLYAVKSSGKNGWAGITYTNLKYLSKTDIESAENQKAFHFVSSSSKGVKILGVKNTSL